MKRGVHDVGRPQLLSGRDVGASQGNRDGVDETNAALSAVATAVRAHQECTLLPLPRLSAQQFAIE